MTISEIEQKIQDIHVALSANPDPNTRQKLELGLEIFQSLLLAEQQKKSESQPSEKPNPMYQPTTEKEKEEARYHEFMEKASVSREEFESTMGKSGLMGTDKPSQLFQKSLDNIKTVKAPDFVAPDDLINVVLEDAKGNEYTRTGTKAQVRSLTRKYFSNVHESWMGKEKKMKTGFKNLLSYIVAWREFDGTLPTLRDVLLDYDRYKKAKDGEEASEAFKVAELLYNKIIEILNNAG